MFKLPNSVIKIKNSTVYDIRPFVSEERRYEIMSKALSVPNSKVNIKNTLNPYHKSYEIVMQQKNNQLTKYQNSILWSPKFTPWHFKYFFLIPFFLVGCYLFYLRYVAHPRYMMRLKNRLRINFPQLQQKGWLKGWNDTPDQILEFEAWTLNDLDKLQEVGLIGNNKAEKIMEKSRKFVSGNKQFIAKEFGRI